VIKRATLALVAILVLAGCSAQTVSTAVPATGAPGASTAAQSQAAQSQAPQATPTAAGPVTYKPGDTITVKQDGKDALKITISDVKVVSSYKGDSYTDKPQTAGNVFVQAKVSYEALTDGVSYNSFDWQVFCGGEAVQNFTILISGPKPGLSSGDLPNGRKASGYVVYEVAPKGEVRMSYKGSILNDAPLFEVVIRDA
jgi:hypothetical protein